uniref:O-antigen ligase-related domain-containing protein n=1 Tax=Tolypothrix bouteillei VB521301 TaxID=1479485 RepID=A0A0C1RCN2_9CYAN
MNLKLNSLCKKLEIITLFLMFLGFFDVNLFALDAPFKNASYGMVSFLILLRWKRCIYVATKDIPLLLLFGTVMFSYFWSAFPEDTLKVSKSFVRETLFGVYLAANYNHKDLVRLFLWMFGLATILNWLFCGFAIAIGQSSLAISQTNSEDSWTGFLLHKQYLGRMMMHAAILFLLSVLNDKKFHWFKWTGLSLSVSLLLLSKSKSSWIGFLLSLTLLPILSFSGWHYKLRTIMYVIAVLIVGSIAVLVFGNFETIVVDILRKPPDFNGRFIIWQLAIESGLKQLWLGYGYGAFWRTSEGESIVNSTWAALEHDNAKEFHAHNGFIDLFLQLGVVGLLLFMLSFVSTLIRVINLIHLTRTIESFWMLEFMVLAFVLQISETLTLISHSTHCAIYVAIVYSSILWKNQIRKEGVTI